MTLDLTLLQTNASGPLVPARLSQTLELLTTRPSTAPTPKAGMHGHELRLALDGSLDHAACSAFLLDFAAQGARVRGTAHGPSANALEWALHLLAATLKCTLHDGVTNAEISPEPASRHAAATAYLSSYETDVRTTRAQDEENDGAAFLQWLAREEHIALAETDEEVEELGPALPFEDPSALYEMLLDSDAIDDVFVSESELASLLGRFRARRR